MIEHGRSPSMALSYSASSSSCRDHSEAPRPSRRLLPVWCTSQSVRSPTSGRTLPTSLQWRQRISCKMWPYRSVRKGFVLIAAKRFTRSVWLYCNARDVTSCTLQQWAASWPLGRTNCIMELSSGEASSALALVASRTETPRGGRP